MARKGVVVWKCVDALHAGAGREGLAARSEGSFWGVGKGMLADWDGRHDERAKEQYREYGVEGGGYDLRKHVKAAYVRSTECCVVWNFQGLRGQGCVTNEWMRFRG